MSTNQNFTSIFQSTTARLIMVGLLTLILLIPLAIVNDLIHERAERQKEVINEINSKWGREVFVYGPILKVPYTTYTENKVFDDQNKTITTERQAIKNYAYFFPEQLTNQTEVSTETKYRSNYEAVLFTAQMKFNGHFTKPDFSIKTIADEDIEWDKATIVIQTSNLSSIKDAVSINLGGEKYTFEPVYYKSDSEIIASENPVSSLETSYIDFSNYFENSTFNFSINYQGSSKISIVPIGKTTEASMKSNWNAPKFNGSFLPSHEITDNGFTADWKVLHINRPFAQQSFGFLPKVSQYSFDVDFIIPVDQYVQNDRASKYGFLIIGLTFLIFFLIQSVSKIKIHIFQYTMIGLALIMFYTLLISITEHSSFLKAYLIATIAVVGLITAYSVSILKNKKFPMLIGVSLSALYGFIFVIIQLENYALLVGSIGLFLILAAVMFISRKIDFSS
jgi:inner membrane protein